MTLLSIAECDYWDRHNPWVGWGWAETDDLSEWQRKQVNEHFASRPQVFPPGRIAVESAYPHTQPRQASVETPDSFKTP